MSSYAPLDNLCVADSQDSIWESPRASADFYNSWSAISIHVGYTPDTRFIQYEIDHFLDGKRPPQQTPVVHGLFTRAALEQTLLKGSSTRDALINIMKDVYKFAVKYVPEELGRKKDNSFLLEDAEVVMDGVMKRVTKTGAKVSAIFKDDLKSYVVRRIMAQPIRGFYLPDQAALRAIGSMSGVVSDSSVLEMQEKIKALERMLEEKSNKQSSNMKHLESRIVAIKLSGDIDSVRKKLDELQEKVERVQEKNKDLEKKVEEMKKGESVSNADEIKFFSDTKGADSEVMELKGRVENLEDRMDQHGNRLDQHGNRFDQHDHRLDNVSARVRSAERAFTHVDGIVPKLAENARFGKGALPTFAADKHFEEYGKPGSHKRRRFN